MVADTALPTINKLYIYGTLEFEHNMVKDKYLDLTLSASHILISGGRLIVGWEDQPYKGQATIELRGTHSSEELPTLHGPNVGAKALGQLLLKN